MKFLLMNTAFLIHPYSSCAESLEKSLIQLFTLDICLFANIKFS